MNYTSLLHLLSTLSWNISSDNFIPICSDRNETFNNNKYIFIYHDGFSQKSLKQHNCSCDISESKINIQHLTLINKENTSLFLNYYKKDKSKTEKLTETRKLFNWSTKLNNGTLKFSENGGISQFLFQVSLLKERDLHVICNQNSTTINIKHAGKKELEEGKSTLNDQIPLTLPKSNINNGKSSINIGMVLTGIGIFMIIISVLVVVIFWRKYRQKKKVPEKVINTHIVSEISPEKTDKISTKVSESTPCQEDYEFCEIPEYYTVCEEKPVKTIPNPPSKPPPIKHESVDITKSSDTGGRKSNTEIDQTTTPQTESHSGEPERYSNHNVNQSDQSNYDNVDDIEDTYNHLEDVLSPQISLNKPFTEKSPTQNPNLHSDTQKYSFKNGEISGKLEIMILDNSDTSNVIEDVKDKSPLNVKDKVEHKSSNQDGDNVELRTTGPSSSRSHSDTKLLDHSEKGPFDNVVSELLQRSKSCLPAIDNNQNPDLIIIENDLYESMDG